MTSFVSSTIVASVILAASPALAAAGPAPAPADALTSFNGTNGNNGFFYGYTDKTSLTAFDKSGMNNVCALGAGSTCLYSMVNGNIPQASFGGSSPASVNIPSDALVLHPGNSGSLAVYSGYLANATGAYSYKINLQSVGTDTKDGIGYTPFTALGGVVTLGTRGVLPSYQSATTLQGTRALTAGQTFGVIIDNNGNYYGDSTALNYSISPVPEPTTWAMMLMGFGMVGFGLRSRRKPSVRVTYA